MPDDKIRFPCPACGINLDVPAGLAGVVGPCPSCKETIQAPSVTPAAVKDFISEKAPEPPEATKLEPSKGPVANPPIKREAKSEVAATIPSSPKEPSPAAVQRNLLFPIASAITLIAAALTLALIISKKISPQTAPDPRAPITASPVSPNPIEEPEKKEVLTFSQPSLPPEEAKMVEHPPSILEVRNSPVQPMTAREVLDKFLTAKTIEERSLILETQTPASELANSCLAASLPPAIRIEIESKESDALEQIIETYYSVDFSEKTAIILVRKRADQEPKVVVDPFLDIYGGRLAFFAKTPSDKSGTFQVIISPLASCDNELIPNSKEKLTLKMLARDNTKEVAEAYFTKDSSIGKLLDDGSYRLSYGKAKPCTVTLRWNREENPELPFLEAVEIKAFSWNP